MNCAPEWHEIDTVAMIIEAIKDDSNEEAPIAAERQVYVKLHVFCSVRWLRLWITE